MSTRAKIIVFLIGCALGTVLLYMLPGREERTGLRRAIVEGVETAAYPLSYDDATGVTTVISERPVRIVALAPSLTETIFAFGAGDQMVARTQFALGPPEALALPSVGGIDQPNVETILQLRSDLVLATELTPVAVIQRLRRLGVRTIQLPDVGLEGLLPQMQEIGQIIAKPVAADAVVERIEKTLTKSAGIISQAGRTGQSAALLSTWEPMFAAGSGTWSGDVLTAVGLVNVVPSPDGLWVQLSLEGLIALDPDHIFVTYSDEGERALEAMEARLASWPEDPRWSQLRAVQAGQVHLVPGTPFSIPGPRLIEAAEAISLAITGRPNGD